MFAHNFSFWAFSYLGFCHNLSFWVFFFTIWVLSQFDILSFVTICVFEFSSQIWFIINFFLLITMLFQHLFFTINFKKNLIRKLLCHGVLLLDNLLQVPLQLYMAKSVHWNDQLFAQTLLCLSRWDDLQKYFLLCTWDAENYWWKTKIGNIFFMNFSGIYKQCDQVFTIPNLSFKTKKYLLCISR